MDHILDLADLPTSGDEMICFAAYSAAHAINRIYSPLLRPLGLTYPQYIALTFLWEKDDVAVGELSKRLKMESSTLTPLLKRLEKLGHIKRQRGKDDERQVFVSLTTSGRALQARAPDIMACVIGTTGLEPETLRELISMLRQLTQNLENQKALDG